jgi:hypothetical protein
MGYATTKWHMGVAATDYPHHCIRLAIMAVAALIDVC